MNIVHSKPRWKPSTMSLIINISIHQLDTHHYIITIHIIKISKENEIFFKSLISIEATGQLFLTKSKCNLINPPNTLFCTLFLLKNLKSGIKPMS